MLPLVSKEQARKRWKSERHKSRAAEQSARVVAHLSAWQVFRNARQVGLFCGRHGEPEIHVLWALRSEACVFPKVGPGPGEMAFFGIREMEQLRPGFAGILEPVGELRARPWGPEDLILVPGAAFDPSGARVGSGGGYYDRFLCSVQTPACGICWDSQIVGGRLAQEPTDVKMRFLCTETGVWPAE